MKAVGWTWVSDPVSGTSLIGSSAILRRVLGSSLAVVVEAKAGRGKIASSERYAKSAPEAKALLVKWECTSCGLCGQKHREHSMHRSYSSRASVPPATLSGSAPASSTSEGERRLGQPGTSRTTFEPWGDPLSASCAQPDSVHVVGIAPHDCASHGHSRSPLGFI